ncbi:unnamed protein product [Blepharisma stoltei]|uniref:Receptor ligand binding region domain-containing protein n=1 Tax=Blepharisma stoltei TaxID=1481888 RepID=A0AAU9IK80_9CILI|nr:unnamed protein product [Blepharisma stoltei]
MVNFIIVVLLHFISCQLYVEIVYSSAVDIKSAQSLAVALKNTFNSQIELKTTKISTKFDILALKRNLKLIIDLTSSVSLARYLEEFATQTNSIILSSKNTEQGFHNRRFFTHFPIEDHVTAVRKIISYLNWDKFLIVYDYTEEAILQILKNEFSDKLVSFYSFLSGGSQSSADLFIGKLIKPIGIRNIVLLTQGENTKKIIISLRTKYIFNAGSGIFLGSSSFSSNMTADGIIGFIESGLEKSIDYSSYEFIAYAKFISLILGFSSSFDQFALHNFLEKNTVKHCPVPNFSIINIQNYRRIIIGNLSNGSLNITSAPIFPGNTTTVPNSPFTYIPISIADGLTNPGYSNSTYKTKEGAAYALTYIKEHNFFEGFEMSVTHTDCGADVFNSTYAIACFKALRTKLGVGYLTSPFPLTCVGSIMILRSLNVTIPHISEYSQSIYLSNSTVYPEFMRTIKELRYNIEVLLKFFAIFQWSNLIFLYENQSGAIMAYEYVLEKAKKYNINIVNPESERIIKANYRHSDFSEYKQVMKNIINQKVRIFYLNLTPPSCFYFIEDLYDLGLRRGDVIFLAPQRAAYQLLNEKDPNQLRKLNELFYGGLTVDQVEWLGSFGAEVKENFLNIYHSSPNFKCLSFDAAMLLFNGLKYTIQQGQLVENPRVLIKNLRSQKFTGCSGLVSIDGASNDRSVSVIGIYDMRWNKAEQMIDENQVGIYDIGGEQLFTFSEKIQWYDNTTNIPSDLIIYPNGCPFDPKYKEFSIKSASILYSVDCLCLFVTVITISYAWKKFKGVEIENLKERKLIDSGDYIAFAMVITDFLQHLSFAPDFSDYDSIFTSISKISMFKVNWTSFTVYFYFMVVLAFLWLFLLLQMVCRFDRKLKKCCFLYYKKISELLLPHIGNLCFLPITSILINEFNCSESIGSDLTQSFLKNDCALFCWKGSHINYIILSSVALICYLPTVLYCRPSIEISNNSANIKARPLFIVSKTIFQMIIIVLNNTLMIRSPSLYGLICIIIIILFLLLWLKKQPYNYHQCNLLSFISYLALLWTIAISSISKQVDYHYSAFWKGLQYGGWISIIVIGRIFQLKYCPTLLFSEDPPDIAMFFKFSLSKRISADHINRMNKEKSEKKYLFLASEISKENEKIYQSSQQVENSSFN